MAPGPVILLTIEKRRPQYTAFGRAQMSEVEKRLLAIRSCLPADHSGGGDCNPINRPAFICEIPANLVEAAAPEHLALAGNMVLAFKTVVFRTVAAFFLKNGP